MISQELEEEELIVKRFRLIGLAVALALVAAVLSGPVTPAAQAAPQNEIHTLYYSDASKTNLVGEKIRFCYDPIYQWGQVTSYYSVFTEPCS
jgi:ABC-type enterobactin transport system permease subunit